MSDTMGEPCRNCGWYHDARFALFHSVRTTAHLRHLCHDFDPERLCDLCGKPVMYTSMGGPTICPWCDCGKLRPDNSMVVEPVYQYEIHAT